MAWDCSMPVSTVSANAGDLVAWPGWPRGITKPKQSVPGEVEGDKAITQLLQSCTIYHAGWTNTTALWAAPLGSKPWCGACGVNSTLPTNASRGCPNTAQRGRQPSAGASQAQPPARPSKRPGQPPANSCQSSAQPAATQHSQPAAASQTQSPCHLLPPCCPAAASASSRCQSSETSERPSPTSPMIEALASAPPHIHVAVGSGVDLRYMWLWVWG
ncbi:uncharacterized protein PSFLO_03441 [Pseudozyma flocculosa]|uniref:Uncharacterized protein n=1 Tax=Pseudozyma flocculosa TaxID=84751 RepID=A0A5C3F0B9_9BASI|nr:uncharacterized protein PSFLO_03441 [Pseudozyma flocculosa]